MRRRIQHTRPLVQRLLDHPVLLDVQLHDGLLQVADAAVDELRAPAGGAAGEVVGLDEGGLEAARGGVEGAAGARCPPAHDHDVEALGLEGFQLLVAGGQRALGAPGGGLLGADCGPLGQLKNKYISGRNCCLMIIFKLNPEPKLKTSSFNLEIRIRYRIANSNFLEAKLLWFREFRV